MPTLMDASFPKLQVEDDWDAWQYMLAHLYPVASSPPLTWWVILMQLHLDFDSFKLGLSAFLSSMDRATACC